MVELNNPSFIEGNKKKGQNNGLLSDNRLVGKTNGSRRFETFSTSSYSKGDVAKLVNFWQ